jgi:hsp70-interacting protein
LLPCLNSKYEEVRGDTAILIAELAQNNPFCQKHLLELDILPKLIELLSDLPSVSAHVFHAISCLVRSYEPALAAFIEIGGLECILGLIQCHDQEKLVIKSMFLISAFSKDFPPVRDELIKLNAIERIISTLEAKEDFDPKLEQSLSALTSLVENDDSIQRCRNSNLKLKEKLEKIISFGNGKEECEVSD